MKITDIRCTMLRLPEVLPIGDGTQDSLIVEVDTDEGVTGVGEAHTSPWVLRAIIEAPLSHVMARGLRVSLLGEDPTDIARLWDRMYSLTSVFGRRGAVIHAISAVEMALWDILGKLAGRPVHKLLGGGYRDEIPAYASILALDSAEASVARARELTEQGFTAIKFGWNGLGEDVGRDAEVMAEVRRAVGDEIDLMLDVGAPISRRSALQLARLLEPHRLFFLEEPLAPDDLEGYAALAAASPVPIAAGEKETTRYGFRDLMVRGAVDIIQPDVARAGGLWECRKIADDAAAGGVTVIPHCWSTDILVAATLHFIATLPDCPYLEFCLVDNPIRTSVTHSHFEPEGGRVRIPDGPGLGVELNRDTLESYRYSGDALALGEPR